ncbi:TldD/PmbA family protein [candidate division CSSED10-310 bacterium]|uniref:TldD/PmbA family protein n=1 Tax=candidate division CSSED10-310 bacterium TaxID=2855610 RepID=A0ABV6YZK4_UNCC1
MSETAERIQSIRAYLKRTIDDLPTEIPYANFLVKSYQGISYILTPKRREIEFLPPQYGLSLRIYNGTFFQEMFSAEISQQSVSRLVRELLAALPSESHQIDRTSFQREPVRADFNTEPEIPFSSMSMTQKVNELDQLLAEVQQSNTLVSNVRLSMREGEETTLFVDRERDLFQQVDLGAMSLTIYVERAGKQQYSTLSRGGTVGWEVTKITPEQRIQEVDTAIEFLDAESISPGMYDIVADPQTAGIITHEAFGHGVELDMFIIGRAKAADYFNRRVGSDLVNIVDDPSFPGMSGSYFFDDEGELARETTIVKEGIFRSGLADMNSAFFLNVPRTPNGRVAHSSSKVYARMSNTLFKPGLSDARDIIASVDHGIYLFDPWNGMEDPLGWGLQVDNHFGREIKGGKFSGRIFSPVIMTGSVPDVLSSISAVAHDLDTLDNGACGKGNKEYLRVCLGGPHLRLRARLG